VNIALIFKVEAMFMVALEGVEKSPVAHLKAGRVTG
jgi:hypothetical protein